jgi:hypothetical protein
MEFVNNNETIKNVEYGIQRIWYAMCICLADILDADHDLSRKGNEKNPLETYWVNNKSSMITTSVNELLSKLVNVTDPRVDGLTDRLSKIDRDINSYYRTIFGDKGEPRTQHKIHGMFVQLINLFGPQFQDIDRNDMPRTALSVSTFSSGKGINEQRKKIKADYELNDLMVETHRGGDYSHDDAPVFLHKYIPSTIFDLGSNAGFLESIPPPSFSLNYFPESNTVMTTIDAAGSLLGLDLDTKTWLDKCIETIRAIYSERYKSVVTIGSLPVLIHKFVGNGNKATYSIQFGQVTADEVTYELFRANRRSKCGTKVNWVKNMIVKIADCPEGEGDILARQCHIIYGKTCGDGVSIDGALLKGCGVLSNDICCCYRAAIVNGYGFRPCPTAYGFFSNTRNVEVFQTKPKGIFDITNANTKVKQLLLDLTGIETKKAEIYDYIKRLNVSAPDSKLQYVDTLFDKKKNFLMNELQSKTIPDDLLEFYSKSLPITVLPDKIQPETVLPENLLKRYCYYTMDQCIGSADYYEGELKQFLVDIKSNIDQMQKLRFTSRMTRDKEIDCFMESLRIIGNIEHVLSSFITDKTELIKYSKLFFNANLVRYNGKPFLDRFMIQLNDIIDGFGQATEAATVLFIERMSRLKNYIDQFDPIIPIGTKRVNPNKDEPPQPIKRSKSMFMGLPQRSSGGRGGEGILLNSVFLTRQSDFDYEESSDASYYPTTDTEVNIDDIIGQFESLKESDVVGFGNYPQQTLHSELLVAPSRQQYVPTYNPDNNNQQPGFFAFNSAITSAFGKQPSLNDKMNNTATSRSAKHLPFKSHRVNNPSKRNPHVSSKLVVPQQTGRIKRLTNKSRLITSKSLKNLKSLHRQQLHSQRSQQRPPWDVGGSKKKRRRKPVLTKKVYEKIEKVMNK